MPSLKLIENTCEFVCEVGTDNRYIVAKCSTCLAKIIGKDPAELIGQDPSCFIEAGGWVRDTVEPGDFWEGKCRVVREDARDNIMWFQAISFVKTVHKYVLLRLSYLAFPEV